MASTGSVGAVKRPAKNAPGRRIYAAAVLTGLYAATGRAVMNANNLDYRASLRTARELAFDQADEMLRGEK